MHAAYWCNAPPSLALPARVNISSSFLFKNAHVSILSNLPTTPCHPLPSVKCHLLLSYIPAPRAYHNHWCPCPSLSPLITLPAAVHPLCLPIPYRLPPLSPARRSVAHICLLSLLGFSLLKLDDKTTRSIKTGGHLQPAH